MTIAKFQSESKQEVRADESLNNGSQQLSEDSIIAKIESTILGLCVRRKMSGFDLSTLDSITENNNHLFIVNENKFIYPENTDSDNYAYGLVFSGHDLNVCDLKNKHRYLAGKVEQAWPSILAAATRISEIFSSSGCAIAVNRASGRVLAVSKGFLATTGISEDDAAGLEFSNINKIILRSINAKKMSIENFVVDEIHISLISFTESQSQTDYDSKTGTLRVNSDNTHHYVNEDETIDIHRNRFNSILRANLQGDISEKALAQVEEIVSILSVRDTNGSSTFAASLRLLLQAILISHRMAGGGLSETKMIISHTDGETSQIEFETASNENSLNVNSSQWQALSQKLAGQMNLNLTELEITNKKITNCVYLTKESNKHHVTNR